MLGHHRPASETPFKWPANSGIWILPPLIKLKQRNVKVGPPWQNFLDPHMCITVKDTAELGEMAQS